MPPMTAPPTARPGRFRQPPVALVHTCLACDGAVRFDQDLQIADAGRYLHLRWQDCQGALRWLDGAGMPTSLRRAHCGA